MELVVITNPQDISNEIQVLEEIASLPVLGIHVRKPNWTIEQQASALESMSSNLRSKVVVHQFPEHAAQFGLAGWHRNLSLEGFELKIGNPRSAGWHIQNGSPFMEVEYAFCSPIFPSISKQGYGPETPYAINMLRAKCLVWENETRNQDGSSSPIKIALSGVRPERVAEAYNLGFDGVAAIGYIWKHENPIQAVNELLAACNPPEID